MDPSGGSIRFRDREGAEWRVHEVVRQAGSGARSAYLPALWQHGWLLFECGDERRRLAPVPEGWRERDEEGLTALLDAAVLARAARTAEDGRRVSRATPRAAAPDAADEVAQAATAGPPPEDHDASIPPVTRHHSDADRIERPHDGLARVLVIDDDEAARYLLRRALDGLGVELIEAATGKEGVALACADPPRLIVLDYRLPGTTGAAVLDQLRREPATAGIPVLWYSLHERALGLDPRARYAAGRIDKASFDPVAARAQVAAMLEPADEEGLEAADG